jgi:putative tryptophan/tyrosine transport system substrate-binding protein
MRRREFILALAGAAAAWPHAGRSAQAGSVLRIGILSPLSSSEITSPPFEAFRKALRDFGYLEGKNINFVYRWADGSHERLGEFATEK